MDIKEFFIRNYQWIIGAIAVPFIIYFLSKKKNEIMKFFKIEQKTVRNSTFYQAEKIVVKQTGLSVADVKEIVQSVFRENFPKLKEQAEIEVKKNVNLFIEQLDKEITAKLKEEEINKFRDPDIQYALYEATKITARKNSEGLRKNLSALIIERVKNDDKDLKRIVYNEAIGTIGKLTTNQLKILTLCCLLKYTTYTGYTGILNWVTFNHYLNTSIKPFLDFKSTDAEFQHLQYASCADVDTIASADIIEAFKKRYSSLFLNSIEQSKVKELDINETLEQQIFHFDKNENKFKFRFLNKENLEKFILERGISSPTKEKIINLYQNNIKTNSEVEKKITEETDIGNELLKKWKETSIKSMHLTSVGIVIGTTYFEQTVGGKINIEKWIS